MISQHQQMQKNYELRQKAEKYAVPTNDLIVKARLRQMDEPIQLFGEGKGERRERLRSAVIEYFITNGRSPDEDLFCHKIVDFTNLGGTSEEIEKANLNADSEDDYMSGDGGEKIGKDEVFYTEGDQALRDARVNLAKYSIQKAQ